MSIERIVKAWSDSEYRQQLSAEELAQLPANPAGAVELSDADLAAVQGGCDDPVTNTANLDISLGLQVLFSLLCLGTHLTGAN